MADGPDDLDRMVEEDDRRMDAEGRDRIAAIAKRFTNLARKLDRRYTRISRTLELAMVIFLLFAIYTYIQQDRLDTETATLRYQAVYSSCVERNRTNDNIVKYLDGSADEFPTTPDCKTYTKILLGEDAPPDAFNLPAELEANPPETPTP